MTIARDIGRHARQAIVPVLGISLLTYFSYHAIQGERGLFAWIQLNQQLKQTRALADAVAGQRAELENRVRRLSSGSLDTDLLDERSLAGRESKNGLAAAAAGGAVADTVRLQERDAESTLRQMQRRRAAGDAGAHHDDVRAMLAAERRALALRTLGTRGGVVGTGGGVSADARGRRPSECLRFWGY